MDNETNLPQIGADDFARRFSLRAGNLMWLLGAGASAAAGIPTAGDMVWEFKQQLFISQRRVSPQAVADLSSPGIRAQLQAHIDSSENLPPRGAPDEYAALFEAVYPAEVDRRAYLAAKLAGAKPSYGHLALVLGRRQSLLSVLVSIPTSLLFVLSPVGMTVLVGEILGRLRGSALKRLLDRLVGMDAVTNSTYVAETLIPLHR